RKRGAAGGPLLASACEVSFSETGQVAIRDQDTCDLCRVNFEVNNPILFTCLAIPHSIDLKTGSGLDGWPTFVHSQFAFPISERGCSILAFFARVGGYAADGFRFKLRGRESAGPTVRSACHPPFATSTRRMGHPLHSGAGRRLGHPPWATRQLGNHPGSQAGR